ncbi:conserved hypothetical protein [Picosynechococcus sp. PCC 7002]|nr:conserved hypothetical protein [Picosynechococcus sp. PCC 7002]
MASSTSWVIKRILISVCSQISRRNCCIFSLVRTSKAPKGSSINKIFGWEARARAIATRCFIPPESCFGSASWNGPKPTTLR